MKTSLFSNVLLASVMVFAVSCGKDSKKKSNGHFYYNPYVSGGVTSTPTATGAKAQTALQNYINGVENKTNLVGPVNVIKQRYSCSTKEFLGINFLPYEYCTYKQVSETKYAMPGSVRSAQNAELASILTPPAGYSLGNVVQYGSLIRVDHLLNSGSGIETVQYTVELNRHAVSNPTVIKDTAAKRIDTVISPNY